MMERCRFCVIVLLATFIVESACFSPPNLNYHERNNCYSRLVANGPRVPFRAPKSVAGKDGGEQEEKEDSSTHLVFPGGGIFFYWQAGAVTYLRERGYDLSGTTMAGASAGALTATLTATDVDFIKATELALDLAQDAGVWDRRGGLQGIWGPLIESWLDDLLPNNAVDMANGRLSLLVTPVPSFGKTKITHFQDRQDLIHCNMASVHLPWFLDSRLTADFRGAPHIDGSFLASTKDYDPEEKKPSVIQFCWSNDPIMSEKAAEFVKVISRDGIWNMVETGKAFAAKMEANGDFESLPFVKDSMSIKRDNISSRQ